MRVTEENRILGAVLREFRTDKGLRQVDLARKLGRCQSLISKYENGERVPDVFGLRALCRALDLPLPDAVQRIDDALDDPRQGEFR